MKKSLRTTLWIIVPLAVLAAAWWLLGYTEVPTRPATGHLAVGGDVRSVEAGDELWLAPLFERLVEYPTGSSQLRLELPLDCADGSLTLELLVELELGPESAVELVERCGTDYAAGLSEITRSLAVPFAAERTRTELAGEARVELRARLAEELDGLSAVEAVSLPAVLAAEPPLPSPERRRVIVLGMDALDDELLAGFTAEGWLPNFSRLLEGGYAAVLDSEAPFFSPVIWSTIGTGLSKSEHGVTDFTLADGDGGRRPVSADDRRAPSYWEIADEAGLTPLTVSWFASWPARPLERGVTLTSYAWEPRFTRVYEPVAAFDELPLRTWPEGLMESIDPDIADEPYIAVADYPDVERLESVQRIDGSPLEHYLRRDVLSANALLHLMDQRDWDLASVYVEGADVACHLTWPAHAVWWERRTGEPAHVPTRSPQYLREAEENDWWTIIRDFYRWNDRLLGLFLERLEPGDVLIVLSDHGFASVHPPKIIPIGGGVEERMAYWHDATGMLLLYGDGVRRGEFGPRASVYDICPTVLALLGLPPAGEMPGEVLLRALEPSLVHRLEAGPLAETIDSYGRTEAGSGPELAGELAEIDLERLRALGYLQ